MALSPGEMQDRIIANLDAKTGHDIAYWLARLKEMDKSATDKEMLAALKAQHGLGHYTAVSIIKWSRGGNDYADGDALEAALFAKVSRETISAYEAAKGFALSLGEDVECIPCKTYVGFRRKRQFAQIRPHRNGLQVGLALPLTAHRNLKPSGSFGGERMPGQFILPGRTLPRWAAGLILRAGANSA